MAVIVPAPSLDEGTTIGAQLNDDWNTNLYNGERWDDWRALGAYVGKPTALPLFCCRVRPSYPMMFCGRIRKPKSVKHNINEVRSSTVHSPERCD
jgi:hypothetical protein